MCSNQNQIVCPKCSKRYVKCPCCGELIEEQHQQQLNPWQTPNPLMPMPVWSPTDLRPGTPYNPNGPFVPMC